jgi:short-subunit dehydrogenase
MSPLLRVTMTTPDKVARVGLRALFGWRRNVIAGFVNKLVFWLARFSPRRFLARIAGALMGKGGK